jgi:hypothetical protein
LIRPLKDVERRSIAALQDWGIAPSLLLVVLWGHGFDVEDEVLEQMDTSGFQVRDCYRKRVRSMTRTVSKIYADDYTPLHHLQNKLAYLKKSPKEIMLMPVILDAPSNSIVGESRFRHLESQRVREMKDEVRRQFNPKLMVSSPESNGNHVIHCTDTDNQALRILKAFGYGPPRMPEHPKHVGGPSHRLVRSAEKRELIPIDQLLVGQARGSRYRFTIETVGVRESIQFQALEGAWDPYASYMREFRGTAIQKFHSPRRFQELRSDLVTRLTQGIDLGITGARDRFGRVVVQDGAHGLALLASSGSTNTIIRIRGER